MDNLSGLNRPNVSSNYLFASFLLFSHEKTLSKIREKLRERNYLIKERNQRFGWIDQFPSKKRLSVG